MRSFLRDGEYDLGDGGRLLDRLGGAYRWQNLEPATRTRRYIDQRQTPTMPATKKPATVRSIQCVPIYNKS